MTSRDFAAEERRREQKNDKPNFGCLSPERERNNNMKKTDGLFRRLAGSLPGGLLWLAVLPLAALGQANYATPYTFTTIAGKAGAAGSADGTNSAARFYLPAGVGVDGEGNLYLTDYMNNTIRKVTPVGANWVVTTLAGKAGLSGNADGTNSAARFNEPFGVGVDSAGNVYVVDTANDTIRKLMPVGTNWTVTTLAGRAGNSGSADGTNSTARFDFSGFGGGGVTVDSAGSLYVADAGNETIRKVTPVGTNWVVTTLAGKVGNSGSADGSNGAARFYRPVGVAVDGSGNLYVADSYNNAIRKVTPVGTNWAVTTLAGKPGSAGSTDGTNSAARFYWPVSVAVDGAGNLYVADAGNETIRKVTPVGTNWVVTTLAGLAGQAGGADGTGSVARLHLNETPGGYIGGGVAVDSAGNLYVADCYDDMIRKGFPASSVPPPILQPPSLSAGLFGFGITGLPGLAVNIESSTNLSQWQVLSPYITLVGGTNYYVSPNPPEGALFYRAQVR